MTTVPDIGDIFTEHDPHWPWPHSYRVTGWLKRANRGRALGPDDCPLMICPRDEAEYVTGYGVGGAIRRVSDVTITSRVNWPEELIESERRSHNALIGQTLR